MDSGEVKQELEATVAARQELGPGHDEALIAGFLERIDKEIDRRVEERVARRSRGGNRPLRREELGIFVPIFIAAGIFAGTSGIVAAACVLVVVLLIEAVGRR